jgi:hypothetical protein
MASCELQIVGDTPLVGALPPLDAAGALAPHADWPGADRIGELLAPAAAGDITVQQYVEVAEQVGASSRWVKRVIPRGVPAEEGAAPPDLAVSLARTDVVLHEGWVEAVAAGLPAIGRAAELAQAVRRLLEARHELWEGMLGAFWYLSYTFPGAGAQYPHTDVPEEEGGQYYTLSVPLRGGGRCVQAFHGGTDPEAPGPRLEHPGLAEGPVLYCGTAVHCGEAYEPAGEGSAEPLVSLCVTLTDNEVDVNHADTTSDYSQCSVTHSSDDDDFSYSTDELDSEELEWLENDLEGGSPAED